jgi:hypothetical protein
MQHRPATSTSASMPSADAISNVSWKLRWRCTSNVGELDHGSCATARVSPVRDACGRTAAPVLLPVAASARPWVRPTPDEHATGGHRRPRPQAEALDGPLPSPWNHAAPSGDLGSWSRPGKPLGNPLWEGTPPRHQWQEGQSWAISCQRGLHHQHSHGRRGAGRLRSARRRHRGAHPRLPRGRPVPVHAGRHPPRPPRAPHDARRRPTWRSSTRSLVRTQAITAAPPSDHGATVRTA